MPSRDEELHLELKYCERCGGLWLRPCGAAAVYCAPCAAAMAELPAACGPAPCGPGPCGPGLQPGHTRAGAVPQMTLEVRP